MTHLLCVGELEALCCKALLVCDSLCDGLLVWAWVGVGWMPCEGWSPIWRVCCGGGGCGHDREFSQNFWGTRQIILSPCFIKDSHSQVIHRVYTCSPIRLPNILRI